MTLDALMTEMRAHKGLAHKRDIETLLRHVSVPHVPGAAAWLGDDCAALPRGDSHLLFAIEGFMNEFVAHDAWFAGWCGVMVNVSDIAAMGGRALAVVDALWSDGDAHAAAVMKGLDDAARALGVPIVGGHSNLRTTQTQLAVAIVGEANTLLTSFAARPGDALVAAIDLRGAYREPFDNWDAATSAPAGRMCGDLELLPIAAERGLAHGAKDISQAGLLGTALMFMECSGVGLQLDLDAVPQPHGVPLARWLRSFPSFGYLLACRPEQVSDLVAHFATRDITAAGIGHFDASRRLQVRTNAAGVAEQATFWDLTQSPLMGVEAPAHREVCHV
ncbi:sll0787 family AIR synthase-like protein [Nitrogeniibacter aestuarii]|uniref:sll0787 family AIR synthase-like protein n=1 Tax=Nitrogeniibacter aestuarii TaxID=2815343 RepID=UPI001E44B93E|nr:sll0787 family AIR synthase-like protein [Nitrogeniibacter aestuarii]